MKQTTIIFILLIAGSLAIANKRNVHQSKATGKQFMQRKHNRKVQKEFIEMKSKNPATETEAPVFKGLGEECGEDVGECYGAYFCNSGQCWAKRCSENKPCPGENMVCSFGQCEDYDLFWQRPCRSDGDCASDAFTCTDGVCQGTRCTQGPQTDGVEAEVLDTSVTTESGGDSTSTGDEPDVNGNCPQGKICNYGKNCRAPMKILEFCVNDAQCQLPLTCNTCSGQCMFSDCQRDSDCGSTRESPKQCFAGKCYSKLSNGNPCEANSECQSNNCDVDNQVCVGHECSVDTDCGGDNAVCDLGVCQTSVPQAGDYCVADEDCGVAGKKPLQCNFETSTCFYQPALGMQGTVDNQGETIEFECTENTDCATEEYPNKWCDNGNCERAYTL